VHFETYLTVVAQVLQQAAGVSVSQDVSIDMLDYILSLREGIVDAWGGILLAFKQTPKGEQPEPAILLSLTTPSGDTPTIRRADIHASRHHCARPESQ
jgi:hypothetical protein